MKAKYIGPLPRIAIPGVGEFARGEEVEVNDILSKHIEQNPSWWKTKKQTFRDDVVEKSDTKTNRSKKK